MSKLMDKWEFHKNSRGDVGVISRLSGNDFILPFKDVDKSDANCVLYALISDILEICSSKKFSKEN